MDTAVARRNITIGSRTLSYLAAGCHPAEGLIVFLHAFPLNAAMWLPQLRALPERWAAAAPDFRGFGGSDPDDDRGVRADARLEDYASDVGALLDALGATRAAVCGCSMGGYAAFAVLRHFPDRITGLLLADTRATADAAAGREARLAMLELLDREGPAAVAAAMRSKLTGPTSQAARPDVVQNVDELMRQATPSGVGHAVCRMLNRPDATPDLVGFRGSLTIVVGEEDGLTPPADAAAMAAAAPRSTLVTIPRAGHLSNLEAPDDFNAALHRWAATMWSASE